MTEADYQLTVTSITAIVVAVTGSVTAYFGYRNHVQGQTNEAKISAVQTTVDGATHALASNLAASQAKNEEVIRTLASATLPQPPP